MEDLWGYLGLAIFCFLVIDTVFWWVSAFMLNRRIKRVEQKLDDREGKNL